MSLVIVKFVIFGLVAQNALAFHNITLGDLPQALREEFIQIVVRGVLNIGNNCTELPNPSEVQFLLFNQSFPNISTQVDPYNPQQLDLLDKPLIIVVHGWLANASSYGIVEVKDAYLESYDYNVILINWGDISTKLYTTSYCDLPGIGELLGEFLCKLSDSSGKSLKDVHVIGHSLGGQMAGFAGQATKSTCGLSIGRITGLDPAGPLYQDLDESERLSPDDADFVDVIHTNEGLNGYYGKCGHVDFHVNCGTIQKGCMKISGILNLTTAITEIGCSHLRSLDYMAESVRTMEFISKSCKNCPLLPDICITDIRNPNYITMGEHTPENAASNNYYTPTSSRPPFFQGCSAFPSSGCTN